MADEQTQTDETKIDAAPKTEVKPTPAPAADKDEEVKVPSKFKKIVDEIENMSVLDLNELVKVFENKFGVSATAVAAVGSASAEAMAGGGKGTTTKEQKDG